MNTTVIVLVLFVNLVVLVKIMCVKKLGSLSYKLILFLGICIGNMLFASIALALYYFSVNAENIINDVWLELFKVLVPIISVLITSVSLIITASNFNKSAEKSVDTSDANQIVDMIRFNNKIYDDIVKKNPNLFQELQKEIVETLNSDKFWVLRGMNFVKENLFSEETREYRDVCISRLESLNFKKNTPFDKNNQELLEYLKNGSNNSQKQIWLLLNYESGKQGNKYIELKSNLKSLNWSYSYIEKILIKRNILEELVTKMNEEKFYTQPISYREAFEIIDEIYDKNFEILGNFFRSTHRIIKKINESFRDDIGAKKNYLGLLRAQLPESAIASIYYNATYTRKGLGLARQLIYIDFFGDGFDFMSVDNSHFNDSQHVSSDKIIFYDTDYKLMHNLYTYKVEAYLDKKSITMENVKGLIEDMFEKHKADSYRKSLNKKIDS